MNDLFAERSLSVPDNGGANRSVMAYSAICCPAPLLIQGAGFFLRWVTHLVFHFAKLPFCNNRYEYPFFDATGSFLSPYLFGYS